MAETTHTDGAPEPRNGDRMEELLAFAFGAEPLTDAQQPDEPQTELPDLGVPRYRLRGELGRGGMGRVLLAFDSDLGREVAIKVLRAERRRDPVLLRRFLEEAQIAGQLQHPGVVPVYDLGVGSGGEPFLVMKCVRGRTLAQLLREQAPDGGPCAALLPVFTQVCQTMAYAHARGVIHRDLKPSNVMVGPFGEVQVTDWGLAKVLTSLLAEPAPGAGNRDGDGTAPVAIDRDRTRSAAGSTFGTPAYMAPEQARGDHAALDARCDVFALGAMLCEILTGTPPYAATDPAVVRSLAAAGDLGEALRRLDLERREGELAALASRCLQPDPASRPADAAGVADEVLAIQQRAAERARRAELDAAAAAAQVAGARRSRRIAWALVATLLTLGGVLVLEQQALAHRRGVTRTEAMAALVDARAAAARAASAPEPDPVGWRSAVAAAQRARAAVVAGSRDDELAREVDATLAELEQRLGDAERAIAGAARDRALLEQLRSVRLGSDEGQETVDRYEAAFASWGFTLWRDDAELVAMLRGSGVRADLQPYLLRWAAFPRADAQRRRLPAIVLASEDDPLRRQVLAARHTAGLRALVPGVGERGTIATQRLLAIRLLDERSSTPALALLQRAIDAAPQDAELRVHRVHALLYERELAAAVAEARIAEALQPGGLAPAIAVAVALHAAGSPEAPAALARIERLWSRTRHRPHPIVGVALQLSDFGYIDAAEPLLRRGVAAGLFHCDGAQAIGRRMQRAGRSEAAMLAFEAALVAHQGPDSGASHFFDLGKLLYVLGRHADALPLCLESARLAPRNADALYTVGICCSAVGRRSEGLPWLERAVRADWRDGLRLGALVYEYEVAGFPVLASNLYTEAAVRLPLALDLHLSRGDAQLERGVPAAAEAAYGLATLAEPRSYAAWRGLATAAAIAGDCATFATASAATSGLAIDADWAGELGRNLWRRNRSAASDAALELLSTAIVVQPSERALSVFVDVCGATGLYELALPASTRLLSFRHDVRTVAKHCALLDLLQRDVEAVTVALEHKVLVPDSDYLQDLLKERAFTSYADARRIHGAMQELLARPDLPPAFLMSVAGWCNAVGDLPAMAAVLQRAGAALPHDLRRLYLVAHAAIPLGDHEQARRALRAIPAIAGDPDSRWLVAEHALRVGLPDLAARWFHSIPAAWRRAHASQMNGFADQFDAQGQPLPGDLPGIEAFGDPDDAAVRIRWCRYCDYHGRFAEEAASLEWLSHAGALDAQMPFDCVALAAAFCRGARHVAEPEVAARWRDTAAQFLQRVLAARELPAEVLQALREAHDAIAFAAVRPVGLDRLPAAERTGWRDLWLAVDARLERGH